MVVNSRLLRSNFKKLDHCPWYEDVCKNECVSIDVAVSFDKKIIACNNDCLPKQLIMA